ncbi:MAG: hypothetical protein JXR78_06620 [Victivallales bacterium]|nr:hypothetical protein [Victivallales bacterium]
MNSKLCFRLAVPDDDSAIRQLLREAEMNGALALTYDYEQSFFSALEIQGSEPVVMVTERNGNIIAVGVISRRQVYFNGLPLEIGYLSHLRISQAHRKSLILARGYQFLRKLHNTEFNVPFYLSSIMADNAAAIVLTEERVGFPVYQLLATYHTLLLPIFRSGKRSVATSGISITRGTIEVIPTLLDFLHREGSQKQFFPVVSRAELEGETGPLKGIGIDNFFIARDDAGQIIGALAIWDQSRQKNIVIRSYHGRMGIVKKLSDCICKTDLLPDPENPIKVKLASCIVIMNNCRKVFRALLDAAMYELKKKATGYLAIGIDSQDPLLREITTPWHLTLKSNIFQVYWPDPEKPLPEPDGRINYFELGML